MTIYGLTWHQDHDTYERPGGTALTHLAVTSPTDAETLAAVAQASTYAPWSGMRRCNLWDDGTVTAVYGDRCYTDTEVANMGQVMVQIPKFWYTTDHTAPDYTWYISDVGTAGTEPAGHDHDWAVHPAFIRNGVTKGYIYLSAYDGYFNATDSKLESKSGVQPTGSKTIAQFRTAAQLRKGAANYWEVQDYLTTSAVQLLYLVEYGGFGSQTLLSAGITNITDDGEHNMASTCGHTATLGNASGQVLHTFDHVPGSGATTGYAMSYRGIENFYGNTWKFVDGINIKADRNPWVADHDFASDTFAHPYGDTGLTLNNADGWAADISVGASHDYGFLPSAVGASSSLCDYYYQTTGNRIALAGGVWADGAAAGAFVWRLNVAAVSSNRSIGARLLYIG